MGRYFQHAIFPPADQELTGAFAEITNSRIAFHSSGGVHLLYYLAALKNGTAAAVDITTQLLLDGEGLLGTELQNTLAVGATHFANGCLLREIPAGDHTLAFQAVGAVGAGDVFLANGGIIIAIEFPSWETSDRITDFG